MTNDKCKCGNTISGKFSPCCSYACWTKQFEGSNDKEMYEAIKGYLVGWVEYNEEHGMKPSKKLQILIDFLNKKINEPSKREVKIKIYEDVIELFEGSHISERVKDVLDEQISIAKHGI